MLKKIEPRTDGPICGGREETDSERGFRPGLHSCAVGDWSEGHCVMLWKDDKDGDIREYQPKIPGERFGRAPEDPSTFLPGYEVWKFQKEQRPFNKGSEHLYAMWVRIA